MTETEAKCTNRFPPVSVTGLVKCDFAIGVEMAYPKCHSVQWRAVTWPLCVGDTIRTDVTAMIQGRGRSVSVVHDLSVSLPNGTNAYGDHRCRMDGSFFRFKQSGEHILTLALDDRVLHTYKIDIQPSHET